MKIAQLTGAYVNAGDFLIQERSSALLKSVLPDAEIQMFSRKNIERDFEDIEKCDVICFAGGPLIKRDVNSNILLTKTMEFTKPIMLLGCGWKGEKGDKSFNYSYSFTEETLEFYRKVTLSGFGIGCRDIYTYRALISSGLTNVCMTGCPAWYDLHHIDSISLVHSGDIKHICVSDPVLPYNQQHALDVLSFLQKRYPKAKISFIFHRDVDEAFKQKIEMLYPQISVVIISGSADGFSLYNQCDLHVGFRVHAHIYNLSIRNRSILIEEDGRGAGVNEALGCIRITAYDDCLKQSPRDWPYFWRRKKPDLLNKHVLSELSACLDMNEQTNWQYMNNAFALQNKYYLKMIEFISKIK